MCTWFNSLLNWVVHQFHLKSKVLFLLMRGAHTHSCVSVNLSTSTAPEFCSSCTDNLPSFMYNVTASLWQADRISSRQINGQANKNQSKTQIQKEWGAFICLQIELQGWNEKGREKLKTRAVVTHNQIGGGEETVRRKWGAAGATCDTQITPINLWEILWHVMTALIWHLIHSHWRRLLQWSRTWPMTCHLQSQGGLMSGRLLSGHVLPFITLTGGRKSQVAFCDL